MKGSCINDKVIAKLKQLSRDSVAAVRFHIAIRLSLLLQSLPDLMWEIINDYSCNEQNRGVLKGLLGDSFGKLAYHYPEKLSQCTITIYNRIEDGPGSDDVRRLCGELLAFFAILKDVATCKDIVIEISCNPETHFAELSRIAYFLREHLTAGPVAFPDPIKDRARKGSWDLLHLILSSAIPKLQVLENTYKNVPNNDWLDDDKEKGSNLAKIIDSIGNQIYFAADADPAIRIGEDPTETALGPVEKLRFLEEAKPVMDLLADSGFPQVIHHLIQIYHSMIDLKPRDIFLAIGRVVQAGKRGGYQFDTMAKDLIVKIIRRYLADYRHIYKDDKECERVLIEILDVFASVGWPEAHELVYRLEEIYR